LFRRSYISLFLLVFISIGIAVSFSYFSSSDDVIGEAAPFSLPDAEGNTVSLDRMLEVKEGAVIVFYRGYF
jgi:hypothetical protein